MSSSSLHCAHCQDQGPPHYIRSSKISCKNVKIYVKTTDRASSPLHLSAPCGSFEDLPLVTGGSRCESREPSECEDSYCPYHSKQGQVSTAMDTKFCCTPTECSECKCSETCETHGPNCPHNTDSPLKVKGRNSARVDPDPLK